MGRIKDKESNKDLNVFTGNRIKATAGCALYKWIKMMNSSSIFIWRAFFVSEGRGRYDMEEWQIAILWSLLRILKNDGGIASGRPGTNTYRSLHGICVLMEVSSSVYSPNFSLLRSSVQLDSSGVYLNERIMWRSCSPVRTVYLIKKWKYWLQFTWLQMTWSRINITNNDIGKRLGNKHSLIILMCSLPFV
jgi:hypothetical protein